MSYVSIITAYCNCTIKFHKFKRTTDLFSGFQVSFPENKLGISANSVDHDVSNPNCVLTCYLSIFVTI